MIEVQFYNDTTEKLKFSVIVAKSKGKWVLCKHRERDTYEFPGGHIEQGETALDAARRELWEETGAIDYTIEPVCYYSVKGKTGMNKTEDVISYGMLFVADITSFEKELHSEIEKIYITDILVDNWTYPDIVPRLLEELMRRGLLENR